MDLYHHYSEISGRDSQPRVVTIGNFDGVHLGHQTVLNAARREADRLGIDLAVLTFEPHPAEILKPDGPKLRLVEPARKAALLEGCGVDLTLFQQFDAAFSLMSAERFADRVLVRALSAKLVFVGDNFRFGRGREAGVGTLKSLGQLMGFDVFGEALVQLENQEISSSRIRRLLARGQVSEARRLLGRCHEVSGIVVKDRSVGKSIGFPTINLTDTKVMLPGPGIYAALCDVQGEAVKAAAYVGSRPTMDAGFAVEAHLLDFAQELYGQRVTLRFLEHVRDDRRFDSPEALVRQITDDIARIRTVLWTEHD